MEREQEELNVETDSLNYNSMSAASDGVADIVSATSAAIASVGATITVVMASNPVYTGICVGITALGAALSGYLHAFSSRTTTKIIPYVEETGQEFLIERARNGSLEYFIGQEKDGRKVYVPFETALRDSNEGDRRKLEQRFKDYESKLEESVRGN